MDYAENKYVSCKCIYVDSSIAAHFKRLSVDIITQMHHLGQQCSGMDYSVPASDYSLKYVNGVNSLVQAAGLMNDEKARSAAFKAMNSVLFMGCDLVTCDCGSKHVLARTPTKVYPYCHKCLINECRNGKIEEVLEYFKYRYSCSMITPYDVALFLGEKEQRVYSDLRDYLVNTMYSYRISNDTYPAMTGDFISKSIARKKAKQSKPSKPAPNPTPSLPSRSIALPSSPSPSSYPSNQQPQHVTVNNTYNVNMFAGSAEQMAPMVRQVGMGISQISAQNNMIPSEQRPSGNTTIGTIVQPASKPTNNTTHLYGNKKKVNNLADAMKRL